MAEPQEPEDESRPQFRMFDAGDAGMACAGDVCELPAPTPASVDVE